jgi:TonB family protein
VIGAVCVSATLTRAEGRVGSFGTVAAPANQANDRRVAFASGGAIAGGVRVDADDFCCPDYLQVIVERIRSNWQPQAGAAGTGTVVFTVQRDGSIVNASTERSAGDAAVDRDALRAVLQTRQLPQLPGAFSKPTLTVHLNFHAMGPIIRPGQIADDVRQIYVPGQDGEVTLPRVTREVKPEYTALALQQKIQGTVCLKIVVLATGDVGDIEVMQSLDTQYGLDDEAIKAAEQWKFEPGRKKGEAVAVEVTIMMAFALK